MTSGDKKETSEDSEDCGSMTNIPLWDIFELLQISMKKCARMVLLMKL